MAYTSLSEAFAQKSGSSSISSNSQPRVSGGYVPISQAFGSIITANANRKSITITPQSNFKPTAPMVGKQTQLTPKPNISPIAQFQQKVVSFINNIPMFQTQKIGLQSPVPSNQMLPQARKEVNKTSTKVAQAIWDIDAGFLNTPATALQGATSLGTHIGNKTTTPQQIGADVASMVQLPLLFLGGGAEASAVRKTVGQAATKSGIQVIGKTIAKNFARTTAEGVVFGALGGLQSGKQITNTNDYIKNMIDNVKLGVLFSYGAGAVFHVALPLAIGASSKAGAVFINIENKKATVDHINMDGQVAQSAVVPHENIARSPAGKEILKASVIAQKTEQHVSITPSDRGYSLPSGEKVKVDVVKPYEPSFSARKLDIKERVKLSPEDKNIETNFANYVQGNYTEAVKRYNNLPETEGGRILNTDIARELDPNYVKDKTKSAAVHEPASALVRAMYEDKLKQVDPEGRNTILFTAGGTGAGKSTAISDIPSMKTIADHAQFIYDTNSANEAPAIQKVDQALKAGKEVVIAYVHREPVEALTNGVLPRAMKMGRTVPLNEHINTHFNAPETLIKLAEHFKGNDKVQIRVIDNSLGKGNAVEMSLDKLANLNYNKDEIRAKLNQELEKAYADKRISEQVYNGVKGQSKPTAETGNVSQGISRQNGEGISAKPQQEGSQQPVGTGRIKESRAYKRLVENLKNTDPEAHQALSEQEVKYRTANFEKQAEQAMELLQKDPQKAYNIAKGYEPPPDGQLWRPINLAVADRALAEKNYKLLADVESSGSLSQTRSGQEIAYDRGRFNDNSPHRYIQQVLDARLKNIGKNYITNAIDTSAEAIGKTLSNAKKQAVARIDAFTERAYQFTKKERTKIDFAQKLLDELTCK